MQNKNKTKQKTTLLITFVSFPLVCPQKSWCTNCKFSNEQERRTKGGHLGKKKLSRVFSQKMAMNLSASANLCGYGSRNQSLHYLHYLEWENAEPS